MGLHPLPAGDLMVGASSDLDVVLDGDAPDTLGTLRVTESEVHFVAAENAEVRLFDGEAAEPIHAVIMKTDRDGPPTRLSAGSLVFYVIERGAPSTCGSRTAKAKP